MACHDKCRQKLAQSQLVLRSPAARLKIIDLPVRELLSILHLEIQASWIAGAGLGADDVR